MSATTAELKILISVLQDSKNNIPGILAELRSLAGGVKGLLGPLGGTAKEAADAVDKITGSSDKATKGIKKLGEGEADAKKLGRGLKDAEKNAADLNNSIEKVMRAVKFMAGGFLALEGVRWVKDLADTAARNEVLATVLHVVGKNAGYSREELDKADRSIQKLGITAQASRQSMTQFLQGGFKLDKLEALAKAAQDTAVVLGTDSSEAFQRMITAVQTMNTLSLRTMGIIVTNEQAQERYAAKIGKTANQLTLMQQQEALLQATLDKSKKLQGAYGEAMGNVGKQITSLARFQEQLAATVGSALLPAYGALVDEFTLLLKHLTLISEEMNGQGEGAITLGDAVRTLASELRLLIEFGARHHEAILNIIKAWIAWRLILNPVIKLIGWLTGDGLVNLIIKFNYVIQIIGLVGAGFILLGGGIIYCQLHFERFGKFISGLVGIFATVGQAIASLALVLGNTLVQALKLAGNVIAHPFTADSYKKPWQDWKNFAQGQIDEVVGWWTAAKKLFAEVIDPKKIDQATGASPEVAQKLSANTEAVAAAQDQVSQKGRAFLEAKKSPDPAYLKSAEDELTKAKKLESELLEVRARLLEGEGLSPERKKKEEEWLVQRRKDLELDRQLQNAVDARKQSTTGQFSYMEKGKEYSSGFTQAAGAFSTLLDVYKSPAAKEAGVYTGELTRNIVMMGQAAKTAADLTSMRKALDDFKSVKGLSRDELSRGNNAYLTAQIQVERTTLSETSDIVNRRKSLFKTETDARAQELKAQLGLLKSRNQLEAGLDDDLFNRGEMALDDYYARKSERMTEENSKELEIAKATRDRLIEQDKQNFDRTIEEQREMAQAVKAAKDAVIQLEGSPAQAAVSAKAATKTTAAVVAKAAVEATPGKQAIDQAALDEARRGSEKTLGDQVTQMRQATASFFGGEGSTLDQIAEKYRIRSVALKGIIGAEKAIADAQLVDQMKAVIDERNKALTVQLGLQRSALDGEKAALAVGVNRGRITSTDALLRSNELIRKEAAIIDQQIAVKREDLSLMEAIRAQKEAEIREADAERGLSGAQTDADVHAALSGFTNDIIKGRTELDAMDTQVLQLLDRVDTYGERLRKTFQDSLGTAISDSIMNMKDAGNALVRLGESLKQQIVGTFSKNLSEKITQKIVDATSSKEGDSGIFGKVFDFMGLKTDKEAPGSSRSNPSYVYQVNTSEKIANPLNIDLANPVGEAKEIGKSFKNLFHGGDGTGGASTAMSFLNLFAEGGLISGPGTGTSDSIPAMLSAGEHVMPADKTSRFLPLLEAIRSGKIQAYAQGGFVQSIALPSLIPRYYAGGGVVMSDAGSASVSPGGGVGNMTIALHPEALNMTMRDWLEHEVVRQHGRR